MEREEVAGREEDAESRERKGGCRRLREKRWEEGERKWREEGGGGG